jgi:iron(III) transport system permease protein
MRRTSRTVPAGTAAAIAIGLLIAVPVLSVFGSLAAGDPRGTFAHLRDTVLGEYVGNTLWLILGTGLGTASIGVTTAWLVTMHAFPGRRLLEWALVLPLALPAYVMAYVYTDFLQFVGPLQSLLRAAFGWQAGQYWFPDVRSLPGAVAMFSFALYPYVYLLARTAFVERAGAATEAGRSLGYGPWQCFFRLSLPLARPAIVGGTAMALMETLADYGTVSYFGVQTFTTGIYRAWFSLGDRMAAGQLAAGLLAFVLAVLAIERASRGRARFDEGTRRRRELPAKPLGRGTGLLASIACTLPLVFGFVLPAGLLAHMALVDGDAQFGPRFVELARHSVLLAGVAATLAVSLALLLAYAARPATARWPRLVNRLVGLGYAVPGSVIAVGVLIPVTRLDNAIADWAQDAFGLRTGLLLTGGLAAMIYAYLTRFTSIAVQTAEAGLAKITPSMDDATRSLGLGRWAGLRRVHAPMLRGSLLTAGLLVFVDVMKELPATLVMRPFNFDTLATQVYALASDERLSEASTGALAIVAAGLVPVLVLSLQIARQRKPARS